MPNLKATEDRILSWPGAISDEFGPVTAGYAWHIIEVITELVQDGFQVPFTYPLLQPGIILEWDIGDQVVSCECYEDSEEFYVHSFNTETEATSEFHLDDTPEVAKELEIVLRAFYFEQGQGEHDET